MHSDQKEKFYSQLGERIREARIKSSLTQETLSSFLGLSRVSVVNIEKGRQHPPVHLLWEIARVLNTTLSELVPAVGAEESSNEKWREMIIKESQGNDQTSEKLLSFIGKLQKPSK